MTPRGAPAARLLPGCDEVFVYDKRRADRGIFGLYRAGAALRGFRPDVALVPHSSVRSGTLALLSGAPRRIGYPLFCNERVRLDRRRPFVDRSLSLAERAGAPGSPGLTLERPVGLDAYADQALSGAAPPVVGLVAGAEWATKRWAPDRWAALATALARKGATVVLLGGPADLKAAARIRELARVPLRDTTGNSVDEAIAVLARCDLVIGGDTGLVHCARALGRKVVLVFGPTDPGRHRFTRDELHVELRLACQPCHDHGPRRCPLGHHDCMRLLDAAAVARAADALLHASLA